MGRFRVMLVAAVALVALVGCTAAPAASATHSSRPSTTPPARPLACDDLVDPDDLATALDGKATSRDPVAASLSFAGFRLADAAAIAAAGGLSCDWLGSAGPAGTPDLSVELAPDPDSHWNPLLFADGPESATETFGSHTVTAAFGDPGYGVTTRVNGIWLFLELNEPALETTTNGADFDRVLDHARPAIQALLDRVAGASLAEIAWPSKPPRTGGVTGDTCRQYLKPETLDLVIGQKLSYQAPRPLDSMSGIEDLAMNRAGYPDCLVLDGTTEVADYQVAVDATKRLDGLRGGVASPEGLAFTPTTLKDLPSNGWAIARTGDVIFTVGNDLVEVSTAPDATARALAEAILGQAY